ncbi:Tetracycline resistance protein, class A [Gracilariopsis chorda]|uniref:Tetracycline resistance protein, class A n=1 Tax=Gracilariopsis chorda TaxID=448386 RepID=A0A2V3IRL9_9FLOR|nr:Tetracycline resistance protein, class A [Gracilariopsis chorda]|eukprot:PXF44765.1 Tetracycline resistance protein, class A [Gracilariopsis chorda]
MRSDAKAEDVAPCHCTSAPKETTILLGEDGTQVSSHPQLKDALFPMLFAVFLFVTCIAMTVPVRPRLILDAAGKDAALASYFTGFVDSIQAIITIFSSPLLGAVSDVVGRKPVLILTHLGELVGLFVVAQFPYSLWAQFPAYLLIALTNAYFTTANTVIADITTDPLISSRNYGWLGAAVGVAFLIGPALGGLTESTFYLASSFHVACIGIAFAALFVHFVLPETKPADSGAASATDVARALSEADVNPVPRVQRLFSHSKGLQWIALTLAISSLAQSGLNSILFLYAKVKLGWDTKETGFFLSLLGLALLVSQSVLAPLAVRTLGEVNTILIGYVLSAIHYFIYGAARSSAGMYLALLVGTFAFTSDPALKSLIARQVDKKDQGGLQGSVSALSAVVKPVSPLFAAGLFGYGSRIGLPGLPFYAIGVVASVAAVLMRIALWKPDLK